VGLRFLGGNLIRPVTLRSSEMRLHEELCTPLTFYAAVIINRIASPSVSILVSLIHALNSENQKMRKCSPGEK